MNKPKYKIIEDYIENQINENLLQVGDQISTEEELIEKFGFSRMTINKAINNLANRNLIYRKPGIGSFVKHRVIKKEINNLSISFTEDMINNGMVASSKLLSYCLLKAEKNQIVKKILNLSDSDYVHYFKRLRYGDGNPIAISESYVSAKNIDGFDLGALNGSFYDYLRSLGFEIVDAQMEFSAAIPDKEQSYLLKIDSSALFVSKTIMTARFNNIVEKIEYTITYYNGDIYSYKL